MRQRMRRAALLCALLFLALTGRAQAAQPHWTVCTVHLDWATMTHVTEKTCSTYPIKHPSGYVAGHWKATRYVSPHVRKVVRYPIFHAYPAPQPETGLTQQWEVTYYVDTGLMADGNYTHAGAAACGYDVPFFTRVSVPGVGTFTCEDHIGPTGNPWMHIDIWGYYPGLGNDYRAVTVYR